MTATNGSTVDLDTCASEPIHIPGRIQSFGALIAVSSDWLIAHCSANFGAFVGLAAQPQQGEPLAAHLGAQFVAALRRKLQAVSAPGSVERIFGIAAGTCDGLFDVALHISGRTIVIEFERHASGDYEHNVGMLRPMMGRLEAMRDPTRLCDAAARQMKALLGFDRVMVYRFEEDDSGEVLAEAREPALESFLGLHYPASDIPPQARALYLRNILRTIADVDDPTVAVVPAVSTAGVPLDLSHSTLRGVSPIHIEYLHNMGVTASLSISIILRGRLWGLFACHHYSGPRVLPYSLRTGAELFAQLFAFQLDQVLSDQGREQMRRAQELHDRLMAQLAESSGLIEHFDAMLDLISEVIPHDGASAFVEGQYVARGRAPSQAQFESVLPLLNGGATSTVWANAALGEQAAAAKAFADLAAGALAIPVSRRPRDYIVLWRRERKQLVNWAGRPDKPVELGPNGVRLTPRKSFEAWQEVVEGKSVPWSEDECRAAESLRVTLLEVILRITDSAMAERARAQEQQELLIAELNHRVRNVLNLIRGLITQTRHEAHDIGGFIDAVNGRIHALALAHDGITKENWAPSSLIDLIETEAKAYVSGKADRVVIAGDDVLIAPDAFPVLALVIHEMLTNCVKYGSLCDHHGSVLITLSRDKSGDLTMAWREAGGPAVRVPQRRGFGSVIVERSIPHELGGSAAIRFQLGGVEAEFVVPARFVTPTKRKAAATDKAGAAAAKAKALPLRVLLVEDNMIIALDTEENLRALGVPTVDVASSNDSALAIITNAPPAFALLDFNLGGETSEPIARALAQRGIAFAFASGYGEVEAMAGDYPTRVGTLQKPYSKDDLARIMQVPATA